MHFYVFDLLGVQFCQNLSIELVHCAAATTIALGLKPMAKQMSVYNTTYRTTAVLHLP